MSDDTMEPDVDEPTLDDPQVDEEAAAPESAAPSVDGWPTGVPPVPADYAPIGWDGQPVTSDRDKSFFWLRENGYDGWIDQDGRPSDGNLRLDPLDRDTPVNRGGPLPRGQRANGGPQNLVDNRGAGGGGGDAGGRGGHAGRHRGTVAGLGD